MRNAIDCGVTADCTPDVGGAPRAGALSVIAAVVRPVIRSAVGLFADLLDRIVHGIRCLAPLALGLGCQSNAEIPDVAPPVIEPVPSSTVPRPEDTGPRSLGSFT